MKSVLIVGSGGREHALARALSAPARRVVVAPGNAGIARTHEIHSASKVDEWTALASDFDLVVVGPEAPLAAGLVDRLEGAGIRAFGPTAEAARLESSKAFAKQVMTEAGVPTARGAAFESEAPAVALAHELGRAVIKADGLATGKGVLLPNGPAETEAAIRDLLQGSMGQAGRRVVVEERLEGPEVSVLAICDGTRALTLSPSQDHKRLLEGDEGPNTGGMGAYAPVPYELDLDRVAQDCVLPVLDWMSGRGQPFRGVLYAGLMLTPSGPRVLEYNVRFGDPEAQVVLPLWRDDVAEVFASAAAGRLGLDRASLSDGAAATVVMASEGYPGAPVKGRAIRGLEEAEAMGCFVACAGVGGSQGELVTSGGRVLAVTATADDVSDALGLAYRGVEAIRFEGAQVRRDIGRRALG
ncbi:MAG: phosphoribosylamine--glycine ligase [Myxococcota bacterium]